MKPNFRSALARGACVGALYMGFVPAGSSAEIALSGGPWVRTIRASDLSAGAGTDLISPIESDVLIATLSVTNTGGGGWALKVARETNEAGWPPGMTIALRRSGGWGENGIVDGTSYRELTSDLQTLFSGSGDYASIEILLRLDGVTVETVPALYDLGIRYVIEASGP